MNITRRGFLFSTMIPNDKTNHVQQAVTAVNKPVNHENASTVLETNRLYTFESDRFRALYMIADREPGCYVVKRRIDWYDPIENKSRSYFDSVAYITGKTEL